MTWSGRARGPVHPDRLAVAKSARACAAGKPGGNWRCAGGGRRNISMCMGYLHSTHSKLRAPQMHCNHPLQCQLAVCSLRMPFSNLDDNRITVYNIFIAVGFKKVRRSGYWGAPGFIRGHVSLTFPSPSICIPSLQFSRLCVGSVVSGHRVCKGFRHLTCYSGIQSLIELLVICSRIYFDLDIDCYDSLYLVFEECYPRTLHSRIQHGLPVMGSSGTRISVNNAAHGSLCALAVFQHFSNLELIKSVHLYMDGGSVTAVQQEFLLSPDVYTQISDPIPSIFSKFAHNGAKQFIDTLKQLNEADLWQCVLEYHVHTPQDTSIIPLLSVSKNPALYYIPTLAEDLVVVERAVQNPVQGHQSCIPLLDADFQNYQQHIPCCGGQSYIDSTHLTWNSPKWNLAGFSGLNVESSGLNDSLGDGVHNESNSQAETLHDWGSDLELASPRMFETCVLGSSWSTSISNLPFTGLMSGSCLISNVTGNNKSDHFSWSPSTLVLESQVAGTYAFHEALPFSNDNNCGQVKLTTSSDGSESVALSHVDLFPSSLATSPAVSDRVRPQSPLAMKVVENLISYCSDESVNEPAASERLTPTFHAAELQFDPQNCSASNDEVLLHQTCSYELTELGHDVGNVGTCLSINMLEKGAELCNQRGATERMTDITLHELSQYFHMPITQASKELKVGLTVLKKRCREFGIPRWPHRKMKSLDSLIQNIQELAKGPEGGPSGPVMSAVKELKHQKRRMEERPGIELAERTKRLRQACFKASYKKRRQALTSLLQEEVGVGTVSVVGELPSVQIR